MRMLRRNNNGFTLVEVMVAMIITLVGILGLLASVDIAYEQNLVNATRNEAMLIAEDYMNQFRVNPFTNISTNFPAHTTYNYGAKQAQSKLRGKSITYSVLRTGSALTQTGALLTVSVQWTYKNKLCSQGLQTVRSQ